jgi:DNA segregation ATPase FtsK/SpoIIIE-like protein
MESRYNLLKEAGVRNIQDYNKLGSKLPYYVVIIDEYGDLILQGNREMENAICRIAQKARAVGIHMIISTQRPDTKIVTGNIKANFPTRIAFRTTTGTDSRVILDRVGAERLTGKGDMLFFEGGDFIRVQCAFTSTDDVNILCQELAEEWDDAKQTYLPEFSLEPLTIAPKERKFDHILDETIKFLEWCHEAGMWSFIMESSFKNEDVKEQVLEAGLFNRTVLESGYIYWSNNVLCYKQAMQKLKEFYS